MPKFSIEIEEILQRVEEVEAKDIEEALEKVEEKYSKDEIVLDYNDFKGYEIREYIDGVKEQKLEKDTIFDIKYGKAILLEGNNELALIKKLGVDYSPYVVVSGLAVNENKTYFEWNQGSYCKTLIEATEKFNELGGYEKKQNYIEYSRIIDENFENRLKEIFDNVKEYDELLEKSQNKWNEIQKLKPENMDAFDFQDLIQQIRLERKQNNEYIETQGEKYKYIFSCSLESTRDKFENQYILVKNPNKFDTQYEVDLKGDFCFNCCFEVVNPRLVKIINSVEELQDFCKQTGIIFPKERLTEKGLIFGACIDEGLLIDKELNVVGWLDNMEEMEEETEI